MSYFEENPIREDVSVSNTSNYYTCYGIVSSLIHFGGQVICLDFSFNNLSS